MINLHDAMRHAGCKADGTPKLAIARADGASVRLSRDGRSFLFRTDDDGFGFRRGAKSKRFEVPRDCLPGCIVGSSSPAPWQLTAAVPIIPPALRPAGSLTRYAILWEAEWKRVPPVDPMLLRPIGGPLYAVVAVWDLTEVERSVLGLRIAAMGN